ncbi:metal ABC transporter permease [Periweissella beninensis]|uniref:metal ABC transporter permease n=1 Tax=Periweissella beninensis TaxID=504936 RepID=UPI0021A955FA|nr:metal ABC transporter permease [Periweissella beninensis]MCT4396164.1 metal ABC transporter permease [Periweissella beninensis]
MFEFEFMRNAFMAGTLIAIVSGFVGVFVVARQLSFLSHTLSEIGFAGAAFGLFLGWSPLLGMLLFTVISSMAIGGLSLKEARREAATSSISALAIGLGILFLSLSNKNASYATNILFGSVLGISQQDIQRMIMLALAVLVIMLVSYRKMKFSSFDSIGAKVSGMASWNITIIFLIIVALSVSIAAQVVGSLLIFILLTIPAAAAKYFAKSTSGLICWAVVFALIGVWCGLALSYWTNLPVSFFIAAIEATLYFIGISWNKLQNN